MVLVLSPPCTLLSALSPAQAQATAFTDEGNPSDNGQPANNGYANKSFFGDPHGGPRTRCDSNGELIQNKRP